MIVLWWLFIASQFPFDYILPIIMMEQNMKMSKELDPLKHLSTKMQEVTSNVPITEKNEKQYIRL